MIDEHIKQRASSYVKPRPTPKTKFMLDNSISRHQSIKEIDLNEEYKKNIMKVIHSNLGDVNGLNIKYSSVNNSINKK